MTHKQPTMTPATAKPTAELEGFVYCDFYYFCNKAGELLAEDIRTGAKFVCADEKTWTIK